MLAIVNTLKSRSKHFSPWNSIKLLNFEEKKGLIKTFSFSLNYPLCKKKKKVAYQWLSIVITWDCYKYGISEPSLGSLSQNLHFIRIPGSLGCTLALKKLSLSEGVHRGCSWLIRFIFIPVPASGFGISNMLFHSAFQLSIINVQKQTNKQTMKTRAEYRMNFKLSSISFGVKFNHVLCMWMLHLKSV